MFLNYTLKLAKRQTVVSQMVSARPFARWQPPTNDFLTEEFIQKQKDDFENTLDEREKAFARANRLAILQLKKEQGADETLWWNKLASMSENDLDLMPFSFIKKYGSFINKIEEYQKMQILEENQNFDNRWDQVKNLKALQTNEEKVDQEKFIEEHLTEVQNNRDNYIVENYMKREPRVNLQKRNFNFEEFGKYTAMYEQARVKDETQSKEFYKLVKYVAAKTEDGKKAPSHDLIVRDFLAKYKLDLIDIPDEFKDIEVEDNYKRPQRKVSKTKTILTRSSKSLENYDVWRAFDRELQINTGKD